MESWGWDVRGRGWRGGSRSRLGTYGRVAIDSAEKEICSRWRARSAIAMVVVVDVCILGVIGVVC